MNVCELLRHYMRARWHCLLCWSGAHHWSMDVDRVVHVPGTYAHIAPCKCTRCGYEKVRVI